MSHEENPPQLPDLPESANWATYSYDELDYRRLRPYQIIEDVPTLRAYTVIERAVCAAMRRPRNKGLVMEDPQAEILRVMSLEEAIFFKPIEEILRPKGFSGAVREGRAIILPFDANLAVKHDPKLQTRGRVFNNPLGLSVIYHARLDSGGKELGEMLLDTTYSAKMAQETNSRAYNLVRRTIGEYALRPEAERVLEERIRESAQNSYKRARYAMIHVYRGGGMSSQ